MGRIGGSQGARGGGYCKACMAIAHRNGALKNGTVNDNGTVPHIPQNVHTDPAGPSIGKFAFLLAGQGCLLRSWLPPFYSTGWLYAISLLSSSNFHLVLADLVAANFQPGA